MPKVIKDVEKTIRSCSKDLFIEFSYSNVDMRMISKKSGIAVGTLYNYYENKKQLYLSILKESWGITFNKLDYINELTIPSEEKSKKFITTLYEDISERRGLGKALIDTSISELKDDDEIIELKNKLILTIQSLFISYSNNATRLAESLLVSTLAMIELHPDDKENNINFLIEFASLVIR